MTMPVMVLAAEFLILFGVLPLGFRFSPVALPALPLLWAVALYCFLVLRSDASFDRRQLWNDGAVRPRLAGVIITFAVFGSLIVLGVRLFAPDLLWQLVKGHPLRWLLLMLLYPVLSVYPQTLVYRVFLMHRYAPLFSSPKVMILASAAAFGFMHMIFRNWLAVELTFFGGLMFAWRYRATGSLALSMLEHSLYGCLLFTVGLGDYFYSGSIPWRHLAR